MGDLLQICKRGKYIFMQCLNGVCVVMCLCVMCVMCGVCEWVVYSKSACDPVADMPRLLSYWPRPSDRTPARQVRPEV